MRALPSQTSRAARKGPLARRRAWRGGWPARCLLLGLAGFLALNAVAWRQAWVMTHYAPAGRPPPKIEALSLPEKARAVALGVTVSRPEWGALSTCDRSTRPTMIALERSISNRSAGIT